MSYDYILVKGNLSGDIDEVMESAISESIGSVEGVKTQITRIFPSVRWESPFAKPLPGMDVNAVFGYDGPPEFQLTVDSDDQVHMITMSYAEKNEVELAAKELGLIIIDEQSMEAFDSPDEPD